MASPGQEQSCSVLLDGLLSSGSKPCVQEHPDYSPSRPSLIALLESQLADERRSSVIKDQQIVELQACVAALEKQLAGMAGSTTGRVQEAYQANQEAVFLQQQLADELAKRKSAQYELIKQAKLACDQQEQLVQKEQELDKLRAELGKGLRAPRLQAKASNGASESSLGPGIGGWSNPSPEDQADALIVSRSRLRGSVIYAQSPETQTRDLVAPASGLRSPEMRCRSTKFPAGFSFVASSASLRLPEAANGLEVPRHTLHRPYAGGAASAGVVRLDASSHCLASVASAPVAQAPLGSPRQTVCLARPPSAYSTNVRTSAWSSSSPMASRTFSPTSAGVQRLVTTSTWHRREETSQHRPATRVDSGIEHVDSLSMSL